MNDAIFDLDQTEETVLTNDVSDEALEVAATGAAGLAQSHTAVCGTPTGW
jgi:hypothetical protein